MTNKNEILNNTLHRPWELPGGRWQYYQEWNEALFLHWSVEESWLQRLLPDGYELDGFEGKHYVSLILFHMQNLHPRGLPSLHFVSDFLQINCRTYVKVGDKPGVFFLNIEANKKFVSFLAKALSGLPYEWANIQKTNNRYTAQNDSKGRHVDMTFHIGETITEMTHLEKWITEKYCLYKGSQGNIARYEVHHNPWNVKAVELTIHKLTYPIFGKDLGMRKPDLVQYSEGVGVLSWDKQIAG